MKLLKFGGTSVGNADGLRSLSFIVEEAARDDRIVVVVSALGGVTDTLVSLLDQAPHGIDASAAEQALYSRHHVLAGSVLASDSLEEYAVHLQQELRSARRLLDQLQTVTPSPALRDEILAIGERLSAPLVAAALEERGLKAVAQDARTLLRTNSDFGNALIEMADTERLARAWFGQLPPDVIPVVTGFIASDAEGRTTTLGRGGSDYTAALLARALGARVLERWTDVEGLYTDDPRLFPNAKPLRKIDLADAQALAHAGRLGMHSRALDPLVAANIPLHVRCTRKPQGRGTLITPANYTSSIRSLAS